MEEFLETQTEREGDIARYRALTGSETKSCDLTRQGESLNQYKSDRIVHFCLPLV